MLLSPPIPVYVCNHVYNHITMTITTAHMINQVISINIETSSQYGVFLFTHSSSKCRNVHGLTKFIRTCSTDHTGSIHVNSFETDIHTHTYSHLGYKKLQETSSKQDFAGLTSIIAIYICKHPHPHPSLLQTILHTTWHT